MKAVFQKLYYKSIKIKFAERCGIVR